MTTFSNGESGSSVRAKLNSVIEKVEGDALIDNDIKLGDGSKAIFGAGSDLQIYHDGDNSIISDVGTGNLQVRSGGEAMFLNANGTEYIARFNDDSDVKLYFDNSLKFATTNTGVDVTGTITSDGLTVGNGTQQARFYIDADEVSQFIDGNVRYDIWTGNNKTMRLDSNGDISFYNSLGSSQSFFWDASAQSLGIGNSSPATALDVTGTITSDGLTVAKGSEGTYASLSGDNAAGGRGLDFTSSTNVTSVGAKHTVNAKSGAGAIALATASTDRMMIDYNGDISFYEDTGTTPKMVWDASADALTFGDNVKATFGAGSDLQIYHSGSNSFIEDQGTGFLYIKTDRLNLQNAAGTENLIQAISDGAVNLYYNNAAKLATTSTGVDVTGTITSDGLTVDGNADVNGDLEVGAGGAGTKLLQINGSGSSTSVMDLEMRGGGTGNPTSILRHTSSTKDFSLLTGNYGSELTRLSVTEGGDISFYEDTGTTPKFFWDASAESLGIGTTSPGATLDVSDSFGAINIESSTGTNQVQVKVLNTGGSAFFGRENSAGSWFGTGEAYAATLRSDGAYPMIFRVNGGNRLVLDDGGNVGIGTSSPSTRLEIASGNAGGDAGLDAPVLRITNTTPSGDWDSGDVNGTIEFYTTDESGNAPYDTAFISSVVDINNGVLPSGALVFGTATYNAVGGAVERMRIDSSGKVGIGTTSPSAPLHVNGGSSTGFSTVKHLEIGSTASRGLTISTSQVVAVDDLVTFDAPTATYGQMAFKTAGSEAMRINSSGNVGIGTSSPGYRLDLGIISNGTTAFNVTNGSNSNLRFKIDDGVSTIMNTGGSGALAFTSGGTTERFRIDSGGNVTIKAPTASGGGVLNLENTDNAVNGQNWGSVNFISNDVSTSASGIRTSIVGTSTSFNGDGNLVFSTAPSNGSNTERMRIDSSGNVGIGTSSPISDAKLTISDTTSPHIYFQRSSAGAGDAAIGMPSSAALAFYTPADQSSVSGLSEAMRIDSSGNVLVGNTSDRTGASSGAGGTVIGGSAGTYFGVARNSATVQYLNRIGTDGTIAEFRKDGATVGSIGTASGATTYIDGGSQFAGLQFGGDGSTEGRITPRRNGASADGQTDLGTSSLRFKDLYLSGTAYVDTAVRFLTNVSTPTGNSIFRPASNTIAFGTNSSEAMRITSAGTLMVGRTTEWDFSTANTSGCGMEQLGLVYASRNGGSSGYFKRHGTNGTVVEFYKDTSRVGDITLTGSTTAYNTSSDYRLKEDVQPMVGATGRVLALKPVNFAWKVDGSRTDGFLAHEAQAVVPEAVTGEKDAVDAEGNPEYQGIDQSKLVPLLTAALQEALQKIETLEARVAALEA